MLKIPKPPIFSFAECRWFLDRNYDDCLHEIAEDSIVKLVKIEGTIVLLEIKEEDDYLLVNCLAGNHPSSQSLVNFVTDWLDLERDLSPFYQLLEKDEALSYMAQDYFGLRLIGIPDLFEALCWSIIGQQINLSFAYKCKRALVEKYGFIKSYRDVNFYLFPEPSDLANLTIEDLKLLQFSRQKATYIIGIAKLFTDRHTFKEDILSLQEEDLIARELIKMKGVGAWTANYVMMKSLRCPNALPYGDVGLYNALHALKNFPKRPTKERLDTFFVPFDGWKAYLTHYLWRSLAVPNYAKK